MIKKRIVVIGGGNGSAISLGALKQNLKLFDLSAVISMSDSGGSSGRLRRQFKTLPPGDIMRAVLALSKYDYASLRKIFYQPRFSGTGKLDTHNLGNLFLTLAAQYCGDFLKALDALSQSVDTVGKVYPVTLKPVDLVAELTNGRVVKTEAFIDKPRYNRGWKIKKVWLEPRCPVYIKAAEAIKKADYIILSPGSLYTSIIATLLPQGVKEAIKKSKAKIIYVAGNTYRADGETGPEHLSGVIKHLEEYLPRPVDKVIYNNHKLNKQEKKYYQFKRWSFLGYDVENLPPGKILNFDFEKPGGGLCPPKLGQLFKKIFQPKADPPRAEK